MRRQLKNTGVIVSSRPCLHKFPYICHGWRYAQQYPITPPSAVKWLRKRLSQKRHACVESSSERTWVYPALVAQHDCGRVPVQRASRH